MASIGSGEAASASRVVALRSGLRGSTIRRSSSGSSAWRASSSSAVLLCTSRVMRWPAPASVRSRWYWRVLPPLLVGQGR